MSTYEAYDLTAAHYDQSRAAEGLQIVLGCLASAGRPLSEFELLDAGCGTGNYAAALASHVGTLTGLDLSPGMLEVAGEKLAPHLASGRAVLRQGSIKEMPFDDASFDALVFNQVLHHLEDGRDPDYSGHQAAIEEAFRVLRPGGALLINACSHAQLERGFWFYHLIPEGLAGALARCVPVARLKEILGQAGFLFRDRIVALESVLQGPAYFDPRGPLSPSWRKGDSIWSLVPDARIRAVEAQVRTLDADSRLPAYFARHDAPRQEVGQYAYIWAVKG